MQLANKFIGYLLLLHTNIHLQASLILLIIALPTQYSQSETLDLAHVNKVSKMGC